MDLSQILAGEEVSIVDEASDALGRAQLPHYRSVGADERHRRMQALFDVVHDSTDSRDLGPVVRYGEALAHQRHDQVEIAQVQTAFNVLEETLWRHAIAGATPGDLPAVVGMIGTILGAGKDALARTYVELAAKRHVGSLDMSAMFSGTQTPSAYDHLDD